MPEARSPIEVLSKDNGLGPVSLLRNATDLDTSRRIPQPLARVGNTRDPLMVMRRASGKRTTPYDLPLMGTGQGVGLLRSLFFSGCPMPLGQCEVVGVASSTWPGALASGWLRLAQQALWGLCFPAWK